MAFALGKHSYGVCDRCGFRARYLDLRMEWTGFKVCIFAVPVGNGKEGEAVVPGVIIPLDKLV